MLVVFTRLFPLFLVAACAFYFLFFAPIELEKAQEVVLNLLANEDTTQRFARVYTMRFTHRQETTTRVLYSQYRGYFRSVLLASSSKKGKPIDLEA